MNQNASTHDAFQSHEVADRLNRIRAGGPDWRDHARWLAYHYPDDFGPLDDPLLWEDLDEHETAAPYGGEGSVRNEGTCEESIDDIDPIQNLQPKIENPRDPV
jgi:hypothetical protein